MRINARALGADCDSCPLDGGKPVPPSLPNGSPRISILLDGPGDLEEARGKSAQGKVAVWLNKIWRIINVERTQAAVHTATMCKPREKTSEGDLRQAVECCRPRLGREMDRVRSNVLPVNPQTGLPIRHLVLVCGGKALQAVSGKTSIDDWRGYPIQDAALNGNNTPDRRDGTIFFPTYHPQFVAAKPQYWHIFKRDLQVAWDFAQGNLRTFQWPQLYLDNGDEAERFLFEICERLEAGEALDIGVDVETKGDWNTRLLLIGIATEEGSASLLYPFANELIEAYVRYILAHPRATLVVQNGNHDALSLEKHGFKLSPLRWDTIVASRVAYPDLPHDLGFLATLFFFCNRWKSEFHSGSSQDKKGDTGWDRFLAPTHLDNFLKYNATDALSQILMKAPLERRLAHEPK